jgi:LDH2 family malate/lactate/ureidoglycolate dehydrogenase
MALSVAARSKVRAAAARGEAIPDTWATDAEGHPTTDAAAAMAGLMQAIDGAKGAHLSLCLDLLAGGLSGAAILSEVPNANLTPGAVANVGHMVLMIDTARLLPPEALSARIGDARRIVRDSPAIDSTQPPRLPGARAVAALRKARAEGFSPAPATLSTLRELAGP